MRIGLGCTRLSTAPHRGDGGEVLRAALDAGVTLLDTADAYAWTDEERGHNERLIGSRCARGAESRCWCNDPSVARPARSGSRRIRGSWRSPRARPQRTTRTDLGSCGFELREVRASPEVVMVMGMPGSGKTTLAREVAGLRLDRDERGGTLADIARTIVIGSTPADRGFATRLGVAFQRPPGASE